MHTRQCHVVTMFGYTDHRGRFRDMTVRIRKDLMVKLSLILLHTGIDHGANMSRRVSRFRLSTLGAISIAISIAVVVLNSV